MAANVACASKALLLVAICFVVACRSASAGGQHACPYPQACYRPGAPDPHHVLTATAQFDRRTGRCVTIRPVTGPHFCHKFATLAACRAACESSD
uniref:Putative salivary kunitz domain protein n=1 Tax=Ixodes scapularis TaxID=6945 RepID=A0A4D5RRL3_IXOSC